MESPPSPLSSRPKRSEAEGSAVPSPTSQFKWSHRHPFVIPTEVEGSAVPSPTSQFKWSHRPPLCHPDRSVAKWRDLRFLSLRSRLRHLHSPNTRRPHVHGGTEVSRHIPR